jgi:hypothetical protein
VAADEQIPPKIMAACKTLPDGVHRQSWVPAPWPKQQRLWAAQIVEMLRPMVQAETRRAKTIATIGGDSNEHRRMEARRASWEALAPTITAIQWDGEVWIAGKLFGAWRFLVHLGDDVSRPRGVGRGRPIH